MLNGILIAFGAYLSFSLSDAMIKLAGGGATVFEIAFFVTLFSLVPIILSKPRNETWRDVATMHRPYIVHLRGISGVLGAMASIYAFTHLPMAEAYALIFLVPFFVTLLSVLVLGERVGWMRWSAVAVGFVGVLFVVRPGFREVTPAHLAGIAVAFFAALTIILLRTLSGTERRTTLAAIVVPYSLVLNGILMIRGFQWPDTSLFLMLMTSGFCTGLGHLSLSVAVKHVAANRIAPIQYSQIIWAVVFGWFIFSEIPDAIAFAGLAIVTLSGLFTFAREEKKIGRVSQSLMLRNRL
ncbi:MAG: DMT family transporter [Rhizobiaceae bacterium]